MTRASGAVADLVRRRASGPSLSSTGSSVRPRSSRAAAIRAVARTLMRSRLRAAPVPSPRRDARPRWRSAR
ncbi:hypothetical protein NKH18_05610 [Streptomyces sp. M10(2022)]